MKTRLVFIGGMGRSGSGLLRRMLAAHPGIAAGPEYGFIKQIGELFQQMRHPTPMERLRFYHSEPELRRHFRGFIENLLLPYAQSRTKATLVEKSPSNLWVSETLEEIFPCAKFIHLVRDGRDVVASHLEVGRKLGAQGVPLSAECDIALLSAFHCGALWKMAVSETARLTGSGDRKNSLVVRYEDLVTRPEREMTRILAFLELPYCPDTLHPQRIEIDAKPDGAWVREDDLSRPISTDSLNRWSRDLTVRERLLAASTLGTALLETGYAKDYHWPLAELSLPAEEIRKIIESIEGEIKSYNTQLTADL